MQNMIISAVFLVSFFFTSFFVYTAHTQKIDPIGTMRELQAEISKNIVGDTKMKEGIQGLDRISFQKYREANERFHKRISGKIDFDRLASISMPLKWKQKYWKGKQSDYNIFINLLKDLIEEIVYPRARDFFDKNEIKYLSPRYWDDEKTAEVPTQVVLKDKPETSVDLTFRLAKKGSVWKICDINLEGEWWTDNFKGQFNHIITTQSYSELIERMKKKLKNVKEGMSY